MYKLYITNYWELKLLFVIYIRGGQNQEKNEWETNEKVQKI